MKVGWEQGQGWRGGGGKTNMFEMITTGKNHDMLKCHSKMPKYLTKDPRCSINSVTSDGLDLL